MKGLLILSNDVEDMEAVGTRDILLRAGFEITTATFEESLQISTSHGLDIRVDDYVENLMVEEFDLLIIPGGPYVGKTVDKDRNIKDLAKTFDAQDKWIAAICAGPRFLGQAGLLDGKEYTAFRGSEKDAEKGVYHKENKAMVDGRIITARGAGAVYAFAYEIIKTLVSKEKADQVFDHMMF